VACPSFCDMGRLLIKNLLRQTRVAKSRDTYRERHTQLEGTGICQPEIIG
jgi:hypothetical protein